MSHQPAYRISLLQRINIAQRQVEATILHFDPAAQDLLIWSWPVSQTGERVPPDQFQIYRTSHVFRAPSCLCAKVKPGYSAGAQYAESAVYMAVDGEYWGEYVACCSTDRCGYLISLERLYTRVQSLKRYPVRRIHSAPPSLLGVSGPNLPPYSSAAPMPRSINHGRGCVHEYIPEHQPPTNLAQDDLTMDRLLRLDSFAQPGLTLETFSELFIKCARCKLVMTRRVKRQHMCAPVEPNIIDIIDLTEDGDAGTSRETAINLTADD